MQSNVFPYSFFFFQSRDKLSFYQPRKQNCFSMTFITKNFFFFIQALYSIFKHTDIKNRDIKVMLLIACASFMSFIVPP